MAVDRDRWLHHGCPVTVGGDGSCPFAESAGSAPFLQDRPGNPALCLGVEIVTEAPVATELRGRH